MAAWRFVLFMLTWTLLIVSCLGWERINESQLQRFYETGHWSENLNSDEVDYDDYDYGDELPEEDTSTSTHPVEAFLEVEGVPGDDPPEDELEDDVDYYDDYEDELYGRAKGFAPVEGTFLKPRDDGEYVDDIPNEAEEVSSKETVFTFSDELDGWPDLTESEFRVEFVDALEKSWTACTSSTSNGLYVVCSKDSFQIALPPGLLSEVEVLGGSENISVKKAPEKCGYHVIYSNRTLNVPFNGCNVREEVEDIYSLRLSLKVFGQRQEFVVFCVENTKFDSGQFPQAYDKLTKCNKPAITLPPATTAKPTKCLPRTTEAPTTKSAPSKCPPGTTAPSLKSATPRDCNIQDEERIFCGYLGNSPSDCEKKGCCVDLSKRTCYYPLDVCTKDRHFVFAIRHNSSSITVNPKQLVIPGKSHCQPTIVNDKVAIFKISFTDCGTLSYVVGDTKIFLIEVHTVVRTLNLKYGIITRSDPIRFLIECRNHGNAQESMASVSYIVNPSNSTLPSSILSQSDYGVELKIAKDHTYSSYFSTYHQPLQLLLGHPVYLELRLKSSNPHAVLLVNYCLAYPRSAENAVVLIHEGCANPNDPNVSILEVKDLPNNQHLKRFVVHAFQFMDEKTNLYLNEEIYFMCSVEVCNSAEKSCEEQCFDGKVP